MARDGVVAAERQSLRFSRNRFRTREGAGLARLRRPRAVGSPATKSISGEPMKVTAPRRRRSRLHWLSTIANHLSRRAQSALFPIPAESATRSAQDPAYRLLNPVFFSRHCFTNTRFAAPMSRLAPPQTGKSEASPRTLGVAAFPDRFYLVAGTSEFKGAGVITGASS